MANYVDVDWQCPKCGGIYKTMAHVAKIKKLCSACSYEKDKARALEYNRAHRRPQQNKKSKARIYEASDYGRLR